MADAEARAWMKWPERKRERERERETGRERERESVCVCEREREREREKRERAMKRPELKRFSGRLPARRRVVMI